MADREKVTRGLECCLPNEERAYSYCDGCPYWDRESVPQKDCDSDQLYKDVLALLREQEPVEPKTDGTSIYDVDGLLVCGKCGGSLGMHDVFKFCPWCGRKVKWT